MTSALINDRFFVRLIWASLAVSSLCTTLLIVCVAPAMAQPGPSVSPPLYHIDLQVWQDRELLTNPKLHLPQNEPAEITVNDPLIHPDKVKVELRLAADQNADQIVVETEIFLPQNEQWQRAAAPRMIVEAGRRSTIEVPVAGLGFQHSDGSPVQSLILFIIVDAPAAR
ncbi:MAG: hypothetical protein AAGH42_04485 [Pseudomonadota bacterium]